MTVQLNAGMTIWWWIVAELFSLLDVGWFVRSLWTRCLAQFRRTARSFRCTLVLYNAWWRHQMETFSAWLAICAGNSPVPGEFPAQRPVTRSFDVFFDLRLNKRLSKQPWGWWFETPAWSLWRHRNGTRNSINAILNKTYSPVWPDMEFV